MAVNDYGQCVTHHICECQQAKMNQLEAERDQLRQQLAESQATVAVLTEALGWYRQPGIYRERENLNTGITTPRPIMDDCGKCARDALANLPATTRQRMEADKQRDELLAKVTEIAKRECPGMCGTRGGKCTDCAWGEVRDLLEGESITPG